MIGKLDIAVSPVEKELGPIPEQKRSLQGKEEKDVTDLHFSRKTATFKIVQVRKVYNVSDSLLIGLIYSRNIHYSHDYIFYNRNNYYPKK